jgi:RHS repeat-associated protein
MRPSSQFTCRRRGDETLTGPDRLLPKPSTTYTSRHIYDGNRVIQERTGGGIPLVSYTRGNDLSGSLEGLPRERSPLVPSIRLPGHKAGEHYSKVATVANLSRGKGGIGGLLARSDGYSTGTGNWSTNNYYFADGNGNITYLVNAAQSLAASYRYDPFGNLISSSGPYATNNVYRFSSKEVHLNSGMYCYLYRFYDPNLQRWINRDPLADAATQSLRKALRPAELLKGSGDLYCFVANQPVSEFDPDGLLLGAIVDKLLQEALEAIQKNCDSLFPNNCQLCCGLTAMGRAAGATAAFVGDMVESGIVFTVNPIAGVVDFIASHAAAILQFYNQGKDYQDCMKSCPCKQITP